MEQSSKTLVETRAELVVPPSREANPMIKLAHFLKPSVMSKEELIFDIPSHTLSFIPPAFEPEAWPLNVSFMGWRLPQKKWKLWVEKMASLHESTWKKAGIHEAILNSTFEIHRNNDLVFGVAERWCPETKSFIFSWGEATITLEDMLVAGYSVLGSPVFAPLETEELKRIEKKLDDARVELMRTPARKACILTWMNKFMDIGSEIEHEAFLVVWLSRYIFPTTHDSISKLVFSIAIHLARGTRIALAPAVLAIIYRDMTFLKEKIVESTLLLRNKKENDHDVLTVKLWSPLQLVQIWVWERFKELQPKPNLMQSGHPRLARWDKLRQKVENVRLVLDSARESFNWRPYAIAVENWDFPKFYGEKEMWVVVSSSLNEDLMAFARCVRVSMLCGPDCSEQYLPHRVAMQFGIDQDLPGFVAQCHDSPEIAWADYSRTLDDVKLFVPSRLLEADITFRYKAWWNKSMEGLKGSKNGAAQRQEISKGCGKALMSLEEKKKSDEFISSLKIALKSKTVMKAGDSLWRSKTAAKCCKGLRDGASSSSFRMSPETANATIGGNSTSTFKITQKCPKETEKAGDGASTGIDFSAKSSEKSLKTPKLENNCRNASAALGNQSKQPMVSVKILKGRKEVKDAMLSHRSPLTISKKSVTGSEGKNKGIFVQSTSGKSAPSLKRKNDEEFAFPACPEKNQKTSLLSLSDVMEKNNLPFPPGFPPKENVAVARDYDKEDSMSIAESLKSRGKHEEVENRQLGDVEKLPVQSQIHMSAIAGNDTVKLLEPLATSAEKVVERDESEIKLGSSGEKPPTQSLNSDDKLLSGQSGSHISSSGENVAVNNVEPMTAPVEKVKYSEAAMGGSGGAVDDSRQSSAGSPALINLSTDGTAEGISFQDNKWLFELSCRVQRLEKLVAEMKTSRQNS